MGRMPPAPAVAAREISKLQGLAAELSADRDRLAQQVWDLQQQRHRDANQLRPLTTRIHALECDLSRAQEQAGQARGELKEQAAAQAEIERRQTVLKKANDRARSRTVELEKRLRLAAEEQVDNSGKLEAAEREKRQAVLDFQHRRATQEAKTARARRSAETLEREMVNLRGCVEKAQSALSAEQQGTSLMQLELESLRAREKHLCAALLGRKQRAAECVEVISHVCPL
jgi:chromosome segregation ATPase